MLHVYLLKLEEIDGDRLIQVPQWTFYCFLAIIGSSLLGEKRLHWLELDYLLWAHPARQLCDSVIVPRFRPFKVFRCVLFTPIERNPFAKWRNCWRYRWKRHPTWIWCGRFRNWSRRGSARPTARRTCRRPSASFRSWGTMSRCAHWTNKRAPSKYTPGEPLPSNF